MEGRRIHSQPVLAFAPASLLLETAGCQAGSEGCLKDKEIIQLMYIPASYVPTSSAGLSHFWKIISAPLNYHLKFRFGFTLGVEGKKPQPPLCRRPVLEQQTATLRFSEMGVLPVWKRWRSKESSERRGCCAPSAGSGSGKAPHPTNVNWRTDLPPAPACSGTGKAARCLLCPGRHASHKTHKQHSRVQQANGRLRHPVTRTPKAPTNLYSFASQPECVSECEHSNPQPSGATSQGTWSPWARQQQSILLAVFLQDLHSGTLDRIKIGFLVKKYERHHNPDGTHYFSRLVFRDQDNTDSFYLPTGLSYEHWDTLETRVMITALWHRPKYSPPYTCHVLPNQGTSVSRAGCVQARVQNCWPGPHVDPISRTFSAGPNDKTQDHQWRLTPLNGNDSSQQWVTTLSNQPVLVHGEQEISLHSTSHLHCVTHRS